MTVIAVTGSTGHVGGLVAAQLYRTLPTSPGLVLVVRDEARAPKIDGSRVVVAEYGDSAAGVAALSGVDVLFMVSAAESELRRDEHRTFIESAATAGVRHIVYTSFFGADDDAIFTLGRDHALAEVAIKASGMTWTILRDNFYSDLLPYFADQAGVINGPAGEGRVAAVARADVADVAVAILSDPGSHENVTYELTGPEALTMREIAVRAGAAIGRPLSYHQETVDEAYASRAHYGVGQWQLDAWVSTYTAIADGETERVSNDVERLAGHPARTIEEALAS